MTKKQQVPECPDAPLPVAARIINFGGEDCLIYGDFLWNRTNILFMDNRGLPAKAPRPK